MKKLFLLGGIALIMVVFWVSSVLGELWWKAEGPLQLCHFINKRTTPVEIVKDDGTPLSHTPITVIFEPARYTCESSDCLWRREFALITSSEGIVEVPSCYFNGKDTSYSTRFEDFAALNTGTTMCKSGPIIEEKIQGKDKSVVVSKYVGWCHELELKIGESSGLGELPWNFISQYVTLKSIDTKNNTALINVGTAHDQELIVKEGESYGIPSTTCNTLKEETDNATIKILEIDTDRVVVTTTLSYDGIVFSGECE